MSTPSPVHDPRSSYLRLVEFRTFEEEVGQGVRREEIHGEMHLAIGQEAIAVGVEPWLRPEDAVVSTHRPHLHALIAGVPPVPLLGELFERADGLNGGKGGHMHLFDPDHRFMCSGIVGASPPLALGYAYERKRNSPGNIVLAVLGDGAVNHGTFAESLNMAALWSLPIVFLVEDNGYAISVARTSAAAGELQRRGEPLGVPGFAADGVDTKAVFDAAGRAFEHVRQGRGPAILVATARRFRGHYEGDLDHYRTQAEKDANLEGFDPLQRLRAQIEASGEPLAALDAEAEVARQRVRGWVEEARAMPWPDVSTAHEGVFV
jgi:TPP-dependent pyruvate/acetoin dehydrogenase alpha subunit